MAFSWFRRKDPPSSDKVGGSPAGSAEPEAPTEQAATAADQLRVADIRLRVEQGLLMAFGPLGDPVPPAAVETACVGEPDGSLRLDSGESLDHRRVIDILTAQQRRPLADHRIDGWVKAMLGHDGAFEPTPADLLADEVDPAPAADRSRLATEAIWNATPGPAEPAPSYPLMVDPPPSDELERGAVALISGVPAGWSLTKGIKGSDGCWTLDPLELADAQVVVPRPAAASANLKIDLIAVADADGRLASRTISIVCPPPPPQPEPDREAHSPPAVGDIGRLPSAVALAFDQIDLGPSARADAFLLRGLPPEVAPSAGTYDPTVKGWILKPFQLTGLKLDIHAARAGFEIELMAIRLGPDGRTDARVAARKQIDVG